MPIESVHPEYAANIATWMKCRDVCAGEDAIKAAGVKYLPPLGGTTDVLQIGNLQTSEYESYKMRAMFYAATDRTVKGLSGTVMRKDPDITYPDEEDLDDIGGEGVDLTLLAKNCVEQSLTTGRLGLLVDAPAPTSDSPAALATAEPYVCIYFAENIVNWRCEVGSDGEERLALLVLKEAATLVDPADTFKSEVVAQYRDYQFVDGKVRVQVWQPKKKNAQTPGADASKSSEFEIVQTFWPKKMGGKPLDYIPFVFINVTNLEECVEKSPTLDLANVNLSHYRNSADLEHGMHFTALPTAWTAGFNVPDGKLRIGSAVAWNASDPTAKAGYMEFSGAGLGSIREAMAEKVRQMGVLGARMLEEQKKEAEAAETVKMRHAGENSLLSGIAKTVSRGLTQALKWVLDWKNEAGDASVELNKDFGVEGLDAPTLVGLLTALQSNQISFDTWFYNLQRAELIPDDVTAEDERGLIEAGGPSPAPGTALPGGKDVAVDPAAEAKKAELALKQQKKQLDAPPPKPGFPPKAA